MVATGVFWAYCFSGFSTAQVLNFDDHVRQVLPVDRVNSIAWMHIRDFCGECERCRALDSKISDEYSSVRTVLDRALLLYDEC